MSATWTDCANDGCSHLDIVHELDGPCTITGCKCVEFIQAAS